MPIDKNIINEDNVEKIINLLKNNKDTVKKITDAKLLPSSYRLYLRSLSGITDPVDESFFKDSELDMMRKKIGRSEISKETGDVDYPLPKNTIGYGFKDKKNLSVLGALTDDETNIDMTIINLFYNDILNYCQKISLSIYIFNREAVNFYNNKIFILYF